MTSVFLSDAHLASPQAENFRRVTSFLDTLIGQVDQLVINGDFFDCWYGHNETAAHTYAPILQRLDALIARGAKVVFIEGNHDFRLHEDLAKRGYEVVPGEWRPMIDGKRVLAVHGDLITGDAWYRMFHAGLRSPLMTGLNVLVPNAWSFRIGLGMSNASRARDREHEAAVNKKLFDYAATLRGVDVFITGHTHFPFQKTIAGLDGEITVINLGDWVSNYTYLRVEDGRWELLRA